MNRNNSIPAVMAACLLPALAAAATNSVDTAGQPLTWRGYGEAYYLFDDRQGQDSRRPAFVYSHNRSNQAALNLALVRADNSPHFETGARLSYRSSDGRWYAAALLLNGWQRIQRPDGNTTPAIGHQLTYQVSDRLTLNSSSFIGNDKSDQDRRLRHLRARDRFFPTNGAGPVDDSLIATTALTVHF